jgi:hypothetical protein
MPGPPSRCAAARSAPPAQPCPSRVAQRYPRPAPPGSGREPASLTQNLEERVTAENHLRLNRQHRRPAPLARVLRDYPHRPPQPTACTSHGVPDHGIPGHHRPAARDRGSVTAGPATLATAGEHDGLCVLGRPSATAPHACSTRADSGRSAPASQASATQARSSVLHHGPGQPPAPPTPAPDADGCGGEPAIGGPPPQPSPGHPSDRLTFHYKRDGEPVSGLASPGRGARCG